MWHMIVSPDQAWCSFIHIPKVKARDLLLAISVFHDRAACGDGNAESVIRIVSLVSLTKTLNPLYQETEGYPLSVNIPLALVRGYGQSNCHFTDRSSLTLAGTSCYRPLLSCAFCWWVWGHLHAFVPLWMTALWFCWITLCNRLDVSPNLIGPNHFAGFTQFLSEAYFHIRTAWWP